MATNLSKFTLDSLIKDKQSSVSYYTNKINKLNKEIIEVKSLIDKFPGIARVDARELNAFSYKFYHVDSPKFDDFIYSKGYDKLAIAHVQKLFDRSYAVDPNIIYITRDRYAYGKNANTKDFKININYESIYSPEDTSKIDKIILRFVKRGKITLTTDNLSEKLKKMLLFK